MWVHERVPEGQVHAVAVVAGEGDRPLVEHADEAGVAALVRALRTPFLVGRGDEEHVPRLDEGAVVVVDRLADEPLVDPVSETTGVEPVLETPASLVVERHRSMIARAPPGRSTGGRCRGRERAR